MKGSKSRNIFAEISKEANEEKKLNENKAVESEPALDDTEETSINQPEEVETTPEKAAENDTLYKEEESKEIPVVEENTPVVEEPAPVVQPVAQPVEPPANQGVLFITPTRKQTRHNRKGFLLSDLALKNLQSEAGKYEISENELINQILEKMV